jgi:hypothetical protein
MTALALVLAVTPLVAASNPIDVRATPTVNGARLRIAVKQPAGGLNVRRFAVAHEHAMHLFVIGEGLEFFAHEHPEQQPDGVFMVDVTLPRPGPYMAIAAFQPEGGAPQVAHRAFTTGAAFGRIARPPVDLVPKIVDGMRISLDAPGVKAGTPQPITLRIDDAASAAPIADLEPYLAASAHLIAVSPDMTEAVYEHPAPDGPGSPVTFHPLFPRPGLYKVWVQLQRGGRVTTASFVIDVAGSR